MLVTKLNIKIYKAHLQSTMLFSCSPWAMDKGMARSANSLNQRMVRHACKFFRPNCMKTETVNTLVKPASQVVTRRRWQILDHILRMDELVPAKQTTIKSIKKKDAKRGRPSTSFLTMSKHHLKTHKLNIDQGVEMAQNMDL